MEAFKEKGIDKTSKSTNSVLQKIRRFTAELVSRLLNPNKKVNENKEDPIQKLDQAKYWFEQYQNNKNLISYFLTGLTELCLGMKILVNAGPLPENPSLEMLSLLFGYKETIQKFTQELKTLIDSEESFNVSLDTLKQLQDSLEGLLIYPSLKTSIKTSS